MSNLAYEEQISLEIRELKDSVTELKTVEEKIDTMNSLLVDVKHVMISTNERIKQQELLLDTISTSSDLRKRENEKSVREIKKQIREMENDLDEKSISSLDKIIHKMEAFEVLQRDEISGLKDCLLADMDRISGRVKKLEQLKYIIGPGFLLLLALILFLP